MPYIGNIPAESYASFETQTFSTSATTGYTLSHAVTNENEIALFINSIRQQPGSGKSYTASNTTLTLSAATASSDTMYCVYLGRALQTVNPPNASVGADQLASSAVTTAKINASAVDNTKVASTIITGQTAESTIADADTILIHDASASALRKMTKANFVSGLGGITEADMYRLTADSADSDVTPLTNWERVDDATFSKMGTGISVSSGIFSFPSTGLYHVKANCHMKTTTANDNLRLRGTNDNFSSNDDELAIRSYGTVNSGNPYQTQVLETFFNCTNVSTHKVKLNFHASSGLDIKGNTDINESTIMFVRLGDSQ